MAVLSFKLNGEAYSVDTDAELSIVNPESERSHVAALIAHWGILVATADSRTEKAQAELDHWYADALKKLLTKDEKLAEWKAKAFAEADANYLTGAKAVADTRELANKIRAVYNGFVKKHDILRAMTVREGAERSSTGDVGRDPRSDARYNKFKQNRQPRPEE